MKHLYKKTLARTAALLIISCFYGFTNNIQTTQLPGNWCDKVLRPELKRLSEIKTKNKWFKVYRVGNNVYAIAEPYNYQEVISYLILGREKALLFDTGMGLDSISPIVKQLTHLPVIVLNSHTHYDHIGGNYEFSNVWAMNTAFTRKNAANGYAHNLVKQEVSPEAFCLQQLPKADTARYRTRPFKITKFIGNGYLINLGGRKIQVIATPGHTPDAISLYDTQSGYLWPGDSFYQGPIFLFAAETDLKAYQHSIKKLASLAPGLKRVFPAHNIPVAAPGLLIKANNAFIAILKGKKPGTAGENGATLFSFDEFSFLIGNELLGKK